MSLLRAVFCVVCFAGIYSVASASSPKMSIVYQPDILGVDRLFLVVLQVPREMGELEVVSPQSVQYMDRTRLPVDSDSRKYYFKTVSAAKDMVIQFRSGEEAIKTKPIQIWSFLDLRAYRKLKGVQLPRRWPVGESLPELKEGQFVTSEAIKRHYREKGNPRELWLQLSDEEIWGLQPDSTIPRWHWVNVKEGCPIHGTKIYEIKPYYPWLNEDGEELRDYDAPIPYSWKIRCPIGGELYPSNDFGKGDMTGGDFPDDGIGGGCVLDQRRFGFIAERCQAYCHQMLRVAPECADSFLATGDSRYVHKALVALSRLAVEYAYLATMTHHRHRNSRSQVDRLGPAPFSEGPCLKRSGFTVYCIDQPGYQRRIAEAYDKIWPHIGEDPKLFTFLNKKGFDMETSEELRLFLEENLFAVWMQGAMDEATASNEPYAQWGLCRMAEVLNYQRGDEFMDWLFDGAGRMRVFLPNGYFRDGAPYESTGGYNGMHVTALGPIVEAVEHLRQLRPENYPEDRYPNLSKSRRYHNVFDFAMNTVNIDRTYPRVGDGGAPPHYEKKKRITWQNGGPPAFEHAYKMFKDSKFAWALAHSPGWTPSLEFPYTKEEIEEAAAKWPDDWNDASCLQDGYGLAMLRGGEGKHKRAFWMMYGRARGHTHDDILHIGLDAFEGEILGHMGYPRNWNYWEHCWITHLLARQIPFVNMTAKASLFLERGPLHVAEAVASAFEDDIAEGKGYVVDEKKGQRRTLALVDVDEERFYCLDHYTIWGGEEAWWTFHSQEDEGFVMEGIDLKEQGEGTLAGPGVSYGDEEWLQEKGCSRHAVYGWRGPMFGFPHLYHVRRGRAEGIWSCTWTLKGAEGLRFKLSVISAPGTEAFLCDGTSPAGGSPYEMKWLLLHKDDLSSGPMKVCTLMEIYRDQPVVRSMKLLDLKCEAKGENEGTGVSIETDLGKDILLISDSSTTLWKGEGDFAFRGRVGFLRERKGRKPLRILVQGQQFQKAGKGIRAASPRYEGKIVSLDREQEWIVIHPQAGGGEAWAGRMIQIGNKDRQISAKVLQAEAVKNGTRLVLEGDSLIGVGKIRGVASRKVLTDTQFPLRGYRYYHGARMTNEDQRFETMLEGIQSEGFALLAEGGRDPNEKILKEKFPVGGWFRVYDYGVGDTVTLPFIASQD